MKKLILGTVFAVLCSPLWAQTAQVDSQPAAAPAEAPKEAGATVSGEIDKLKSEVKKVLAESKAGAESVVREIPGASMLSDRQVVGIAVGVVVGAVAADLLGGNGLATISLAAGGGVLGNWLAGAF